MRDRCLCPFRCPTNRPGPTVPDHRRYLYRYFSAYVPPNIMSNFFVGSSEARIKGWRTLDINIRHQGLVLVSTRWLRNFVQQIIEQVKADQLQNESPPSPNQP